MGDNFSVQFFDKQFQRQVAAGEYALNPFETAALPYLDGKVIDYGCGLGNLAIEAARRGCSVLALDASHSAIKRLGEVSELESLELHAEQADLRTYDLADDFDVVVCIGLLMFFSCPEAYRQLSQLQTRTRPGGVCVVNVLIEGTTYMDMFSPEGHCLFGSDDLRARFAGWKLLSFATHGFAALGGKHKVFATVVARKSHAAHNET